MNALQATRSASVGSPDPRRLLAAAIVGSLGIVVLSVALGAFVVGSRHDLPASAAGDARSLVAAVPWIVSGGLAHLLVAAAIASGGRRVKRAAAVATVVAAVAVAAVAAIRAAGVDPVTLARTGQPAAKLVAEILVVGAAYAAAAVLAWPSNRTS
jgi:hypothetical protein